MMVFQCVTELYNKLFSINLAEYVVFFFASELLSVEIALWTADIMSDVSGGIR